MQDSQAVYRKACHLLSGKGEPSNRRNQWLLGLRAWRQQRRLQNEESMIILHNKIRIINQCQFFRRGVRVDQLCFFNSIKIIFLYIQFMNNPQLLATLRSQQEEIRRLRQELANKNSVNYEEKYKKALKSIEEIIRANQQIKDELDALRTMRNAEAESIAQIQKEEFRKAYDALLKQKNTLAISYQSLQLENEKLKCTVAELENQVSLYKADRFQKSYEERQTHQPTVQPDILGLGLVSGENSPRKAENRDTREVSQVLREKEAEYHRTLQNYEEHHSNLIRTNKRLEERLGELENKLTNTEKNYKNKLENKELEVIQIKALTRQEFTEHIAALRKENSSLKIANNDLLIKIQSLEKNNTHSLPQKFDWQADLVQEMIAVKSNLQPLRQQISELQELNIYEKEQSIRQKTTLRTQVLELEAEVQRQNQTIKSLQRKIVESHQEKLILEEKASSVRKYEEQNQLLKGKIIVMQSREVALRNRTGQQLEERVLQFQNRIELLLSNKQGLKELREINIHQFLALKAYIMELDAKIKELVGSNNYLTKKYKSYKEKYQNSLKEHRQYEMTINSLKMKIMGYDKLVIKLQQELEIRVSNTQEQTVQLNIPAVSDDAQLYRKKYELMKEKLDIQEKYKSQEIETLKLNYQTRIMQINIQVEQMRSLKETLELYRSKNEELQMLLTRKDSELYESKRLSSLKASHLEPEPASTRQTKDIINNLHLTIKQSDESIFKLQAELRTKEENYKKIIGKLERELAEVKEEHARQISKKDIEFNLQYEQQIKKYKLKVSDLEHELHLLQLGHKDQYNKKTDDFELKLKQLEVRVQEAEEQREEEIFSKRRLEKQVLNLTLDKEQLQGILNDLEGKLTNLKQLERENQELKSKSTFSFKQDFAGSMDYQLQSKDNIIRKLNTELLELKSTIGEYSEKDITIGSLKNQIYYLKQQNQDLTQTINKYNQQIISLKANIDHNRTSYNSGLESMLEEKESILNKLRKDLTNKQFRIRQLQDEIARLDETTRKMRKDLSEIQYLRQDNERIQRALDEKGTMIERIKYQSSGYEQQVEKYKQQLSFMKDNLQKINYQLLERDDQISKLNLELSTASLKGKEQFENRYLEELQVKERQYNKINSDYLALKSTFTLLEEDKSYHEENYKRANNELMNIRTQYNLLQDQNAALSDQLYRKTQEISKLQFSVQNFQGQLSDFSQKDEQLYKIRNELFALRTSNSAFEDELYNKQANISRVQKQLNYMKQQYSQLEQELKIRQQTINRLNFEVNNARRQNEQTYESLQEKDIIINRLNIDLTNQKNKYNELEEEVEERQQQFTNASQEINQLRANLGYYEDDIEEKKGQIVRLSNEREVLRAEIVRLNEEITDRNVEINRLKQQIFGIKMEISQNEYEKQFKSQQEIMSFKAKINMLEHELEDKQTELRRLSIELETSRYKPAAAVPEVSEEEIQELRNEVSKKQRELISMKYELDDKQFQLESANSTLNMLKNNINQQQIAFEEERAELDRIIRDVSLRERKCNQEITFLNDQIQRLRALSQVEKPKAYDVTYSEEEMNLVQDKLSQKQAEIISVKSQLQEKEFYIENLTSKMTMQEHLIQQLELQFQQYQTRSEADIQEFIKREKTYRQTIDDLQENHQRQMQETQFSHERAMNAASTAQQEGNYDLQQVIRSNIAEIDRLNRIVADLQEEIGSFKLKLSSMVNQENRLQENLVTMVLLFSEIEALRDRMKVKETEINEVRKSFIQMTVAGEIESNKMSRILSLAKQRLESHEQLEYESNPRSEISTPKDVDTPIRQPFEEFRHQLSHAAPLELGQFDKSFLKKEQQQHKEQIYYPLQTEEHEFIEGQSQGQSYEVIHMIQHNVYQPPEEYTIENKQTYPEDLRQGSQQEAIQQREEHQEQYQALEQQVEQSGTEDIRSPEGIQQNPAEQSVPQSSEGSGAQPQPNQPREEKKNEIGGSLILQLQKEPQRLNQSRAGQIIIKIPSTSQVSVTRSLVSEPPKIVAQPVYPQPPLRIVNPPYSMAQAPRHSQQVIHQVGQHHLPYHSQGMVPPQQQIVRVSPSGRVVGPASQSMSPAHRPSFS